MRDSDLAVLQVGSWELAQIKVTPANANAPMKIGDMRSRRPPRPSFQLCRKEHIERYNRIKDGIIEDKYAWKIQLQLV
jgi:hypothetical protein